ncbi:hypothetical protein M5K25_023202 [Dendrobium thyrsiflorum]|uniref:Uncharacterized protein n=1 Tax=Dendrobium thyrsiflorum TaxID=117978 RepID=A0ABD0UEG5_DENTH
MQCMIKRRNHLTPYKRQNNLPSSGTLHSTNFCSGRSNPAPVLRRSRRADQVWELQPSCIRLVSEPCGEMTDKGKGLAAEEERSLETVWENQANILRRLDVLSADVQRLSLEVRRESNLNRTRAAPHQLRREQAPAMGPGSSPESSRRSGLGAAAELHHFYYINVHMSSHHFLFL